MYLTVDNCCCMKFSLKEKNVVITDMLLLERDCLGDSYTLFKIITA